MPPTNKINDSPIKWIILTAYITSKLQSSIQNVPLAFCYSLPSAGQGRLPVNTRSQAQLFWLAYIPGLPHYLHTALLCYKVGDFYLGPFEIVELSVQWPSINRDVYCSFNHNRKQLEIINRKSSANRRKD